MFATPVDQLIPHIRRLLSLECSKCPRKSVMVDDGVSTAIAAKQRYEAGWRVKDGKLICWECANEADRA